MKWLGVVLVVSLAWPAWGDDGDALIAEERTDEFHDTLIEVLQVGEYAARYALLEPAVERLFDLGTIARISLGRTWRTLTAEQQAAFVELLRVSVVATYASRFDEFNDQRFERVETVATRQGWVVKTQLVRRNAERVNLDYYYRDARVFNVVADGVSDLSLRRADYNSIIKQEGYVALVQYVEAKIQESGGRR